MNKKCLIAVACTATIISFNAEARTQLRAPAYPLITIDPYTNVWSMGDTLYADATRHWTGREQPLTGVLTVDGREYRFMGRDFTYMEMTAPNAEWGQWRGHVRTYKPDPGWALPDFYDSTWNYDKAGYGSTWADGEYIMVKNEFCRPGGGSQWVLSDIWVRRKVEMPENIADLDAWLDYTIEDDAEFYINGKRLPAIQGGNELTDHLLMAIPPGYLVSGANTIAVHGRHGADKYGIVDFGILTTKRRADRFPHTAKQTGVSFSATSTDYVFTCGPVDLSVTFTAPVLPGDLELASRPVNYMTYAVKSNDGKAHQVSLKVLASPLHAVDFPGQPTDERIERAGNLTLLSTGSTDQRILEKWGDDRRIDWGRFYIAADSKNTTFAVDNKELTLDRRLGNVKDASGFIMFGYDDIFSLNYMGKHLRPYWNRDGKSTIAAQFLKAAKEYGKLIKESRVFDRELVDAATAVGGDEYADLCALAWRQVMGAHKLCQTADGMLIFPSKENFSNGSIGTVDLSYPSIPMFLLYNIELAKGLINPIFDYCSSDAWSKPFAAHDVGRYPRALGQNYGGDMPVEESGNMLIMAAAIARAEGNADYASKYWHLLTQWEQYLEQYGLDPENQLCTDDFAGHFAHNANLSIKAILGIAAYGYLAGMRGNKDAEKLYMDKARAMAAQWQSMSDDGDHYRLSFDKPGTWSQKYNLVWDKIMGWNIFDPKIAHKEVKHYLAVQNKYGLPLDCRQPYTKTDWIMWSATLADDDADFRSLVAPVWKFMNETTDRKPMTDWIYTDKPDALQFRNRSVVGAYFIKMLPITN